MPEYCLCMSCANSSSIQSAVYPANSKLSWTALLKVVRGSCCKQVTRRRLPQHCHFCWSMKLQMHSVKCIQWAAMVEMSRFWRQSKSWCVQAFKNANQNQAMQGTPRWPQIHESDEIRWNQWWAIGQCSQVSTKEVPAAIVLDRSMLHQKGLNPIQQTVRTWRK